MRRQVGLVLSLVFLASAASFAEDETATPEKDTRRHVKVLQNPYDISSFYTSSQSSPFAGYSMDEDVTDPYSISSYYTQDAPDGRYPISSFYRQDAPDGRYPISSFYRQDSPTDRYPIAGFYRQGARGRYSRFWTVSPRRGVVAAAPGRLRRRIATRELCLLAPTVLVPFAPFVTDVR
jgi:hypothetical protein